LRELPYLCKVQPAFRGPGRGLLKCTPGSRRTGVVDRPVNNLSSGRMSTNVLSRYYIAIILVRDARAINAGAKSGCCHAIGPGENVSQLLRQHASALLLIEKDYR